MKFLIAWILLGGITLGQDVQLLKIRGQRAYSPPSERELLEAKQQILGRIGRVEAAKIDRKAKDASSNDLKSSEPLTFTTRAAQKQMLAQELKSLLHFKAEVWNTVPWRIPDLESNSLDIGKAGFLVPAWSDDGDNRRFRPAPSFQAGSIQASAYMAQLQSLALSAEDRSCKIKIKEWTADGLAFCLVGDYFVLIFGLKQGQASTVEEMRINEPLFVKNIRTINSQKVPELYPLDMEVVRQIKDEIWRDTIKKRMRTWKSADRKFSVEAALIALAEKTATLQRGDGSKIEIDLAKLSKADRDYVEEVLGAR